MKVILTPGVADRFINIIKFIKMAFLLIILVFAFYQLRALFSASWYVSHDGIFHLIRAREFFHSLTLGYFPVRWAFHLDNNFGLPIFNFIYPGPYYISSLFHFLGFSPWSAVKLLIILSYFLGGLGIFLILQKRQQYLALIAGLLYLLVPYQFLNIFVRCALGEVVAMAVMPWVWLSFQDLFAKKRLHWYHPLTLALLFLSHNFLAVFFFFFFLVYLIFFKKINKQVIFSLFFSLGLAAFFLLPMILESKYLASIEQKQASYQYYDKAVSLKNLIYSPWGFGFSAHKSEEQMSFQLGLAGILAALMAFLILLKNKTSQNLLLFYLLAFALAVFLATPYSRFLISFLPWLSFSHFPYRFLFLTTFLTPLIAFEVLYFFYRQNKKISFLVAFFLLSLALYNTRNYKRPMMSLTADEVKQELVVNQHLTTTTNRREVLPKWVQGEREIQDNQAAQYDFTIDSNKEKNSFILLPVNYFPSWQVKVDGTNQKNILSPSSQGWLKLQVLPEEHCYQVYLGQTVLEKLANLTSLFSLGFLIMYTTKFRRVKTAYRYAKGKSGNK